MAAARPDLRRRVQAQRADVLAHDLVRSRRVVTRRDGVRLQIDDRWLLNFCGNDYLGLAQQFQVVDAVQGAAARDGVGGIGSHLVCGHHVAHEALEREVADWLQVPRALVFGSGYAANLAVQQALLGEDDTSVQDRLNHASLIDGARLAGCRLRRYPHGDAEGALRQLRTVPTGAAMLATDGVFSMDGDVAPLRQLALVARVQSALLYVDDAHGVGVLGPGGRGSVAEARLGVDEVPLQLVTLGKALGGYGAVVAGDVDLVEHLAGNARPYLYTTALPPPQAAAALAAVKLARREHWRRDKLAALVQRFRDGMHARGFALPDSATPIQPVPCGDNARALDMAARLEVAGFRVAAIRPPTVPEGRARLRVTLCAAHGDDQVDALVAALARARDDVDAARAA
ncbi:8-amino-7-oxononanoate synthase [Luteimonas sp. MC1750]|uniref:8-amino-7-oxononanoate synthase n=1 Tax=Luteimonas sp. MC1750 TaxID=2799326 RepID=UPI0018F0D6A7|nr:8-amino-7-oxononanoate synthase [Luteimonas sp. MC1750]MBJ6985200.1 8-amino-7-oxononanoate synthase [Luteimonas sp. MC1750]QQO05849.1 8-amino-7-oxononanoate synthase [Luteimonas sp. MC1750]